jgi:hypothetical protein
MSNRKHPLAMSGMRQADSILRFPVPIVWMDGSSVTSRACTVCGRDDMPLCVFGRVVLCTACVALGHWADYGIDECQAKAAAMGWGEGWADNE